MHYVWDVLEFPKGILHAQFKIENFYQYETKSSYSYRDIYKKFSTRFHQTDLAKLGKNSGSEMLFIEM